MAQQWRGRGCLSGETAGGEKPLLSFFPALIYFRPMQEAGGLVACLANGRVHVYNLESLARFDQTFVPSFNLDVLAEVEGILPFSSRARR